MKKKVPRLITEKIRLTASVWIGWTANKRAATKAVLGTRNMTHNL
jgi:hypothetical protein